VTAPADSELDRARAAAATVTDPELPMLTLADLGVLRAVRRDADGAVVVVITPTYLGCPALDTMRDDLAHALTGAGLPDARIALTLDPPWTSDSITPAGRRALAEAGIVPPGAGPAAARRSGPVPLTLWTAAPQPRCPRCGGTDTVEVSHFGATACRALHRCRECREPFERFKVH
jgi:ring-1,2-phenylacetyl-CoA epoxidase subunit PaaD